MYHCIMLDRLLDCYNISTSNPVFEKQDEINAFLLEKAQKMLGHLKSIIWEDGSIPLLNDAAYEIAPTAGQLFDYADCLGIKYAAIPMKECGYRKLRNKRMEAIVDVGNITASYQPGHSHADTFNFELRVDGMPLIVDTGISTYNKTSRRLYERSTAAHNTVTINGRDSSEVWSGFRMGKRAKVSIKTDNDKEIEASHNGFGKQIHKRVFFLKEREFIVEDYAEGGEATMHLQFSPAKDIQLNGNRIMSKGCNITIDNAEIINIIDENVSERYNELKSTKTIEVKFKDRIKTTFTVED